MSGSSKLLGDGLLPCDLVIEHPGRMAFVDPIDRSEWARAAWSALVGISVEDAHVRQQMIRALASCGLKPGGAA
jgi:hypothetical protein